VEIDPKWYRGIEEGTVDAYATDMYHIAEFYPGLGPGDLITKIPSGLQDTLL